jgi:hypothetical protein
VRRGAEKGDIRDIAMNFSDVEGATPQSAGAASETRTAATQMDREPLQLDERTPPVNGQDVRAAVVGLPYLMPTERAATAASILRPDRAGAAATVGQLSDALLLRYGTFDMSPATLAYLQEVCGSFGPWTRAPTTPG